MKLRNRYVTRPGHEVFTTNPGTTTRIWHDDRSDEEIYREAFELRDSEPTDFSQMDIYMRQFHSRT